MSYDIPFDYEASNDLKNTNVHRMEYDAHVALGNMRLQHAYEQEKRLVFSMIAAHRVSVAKWTAVANRFKSVMLFGVGVVIAHVVVILVARITGDELPVAPWFLTLVAFLIWLIPYIGYVITSQIRHRRVVERNNEELRLKSRLMFLKPGPH